MDPLHKTDSAISVASRDQLFHERKLHTTNTTTTANTFNASDDRPRAAPSLSSTSPSLQAQQQRYQPHQGAPSPHSCPVSLYDPSALAGSGSAQVQAVPVTQRPTMENLVAPLDVAQRHPPPLFVDRPDPSWYETQLRPPTPPKYDVDPALTKSSSDKSSKAAPVSLSTARTTDSATTSASTSDAATTNTASTTDDSAPPTSALGGRSPSPSVPEDPTEEAEEEQQFAYSHHEAQDPDALTQAGTGTIVVDQEQLDLESDQGYESDRASFASTSLSSSVRDYLFENGRRYHRFREGRYNFPNDEPEQDREDMKHQCVKMLCQNQLFFAPIEEGPLQNVLDIGTGTGIWAIEMGDQFPSANVLGIDLSPIQPEWVPANVHFVVDDAESDWIYPDNHFDYIHTRHTVMAIKDWPKLYRTAQQYIRPGGWIESQEIWHYPISANNSMPPDHPIAQYWGLINEGLQRLGVDFHACAGGKIAKMMRDAGYQNVHERIFHVPIGTWAKHPNLKMVGEYWRHVLLEGIQAIALGPLTRGCGWTRDQVEVFLIEVRRAYYNNSCLMYMPMYVTYGQKPEH